MARAGGRPAARARHDARPRARRAAARHRHLLRAVQRQPLRAAPPGRGGGDRAGQPRGAAAARRLARRAAGAGVGGATARLGRLAPPRPAGAALRRRGGGAGAAGRRSSRRVFFNLGIETWFSDRVRTALEASLQASRGYLEEHRNTIRGDALAMAADLSRARVLLPDSGIAFARVLATHTTLRNLTEAVVFDPATQRVIAHAGFTTSFTLEPPGEEAIAEARLGEVAVLPGGERVRALVSLDFGQGWMLLIGRPLDPTVLTHQQSRRARGGAVRRARPQPLRPADHLRDDLRHRGAAGADGGGADRPGARQPARAPDRPADRGGGAGAGRRPLDPRAGGLGRRRGRQPVARLQPHDQPARGAAGRADAGLPPDRRPPALHRNGAGRRLRRRGRASTRKGASTCRTGAPASCSGLDIEAAIGLPLASVVPEFAPLLAAMRDGGAATPEKARTAEIRIGPSSNRRTLLARIGVELQAAARRGCSAARRWWATSSPSTTSPSSSRRSARRPGPTWRGGSRTRSRTR